MANAPEIADALIQAENRKMSESTVFYSWQSDLWETRAVIRWALERAAKQLNSESTVEDALRVDEDTAEVAGWPEIASTILVKIGEASLFVADITPINGPSADGRLTPNPNVMFELGYALGSMRDRNRIICVVNTAYLPDDNLVHLPFDVRGGRPLQFKLADPVSRGAEKGKECAERIKVRKDLAKRMEGSLRKALEAIQLAEDSRTLSVRPALATDGKGTFQVQFALKNPIPFQLEYFVKEPGGKTLSPVPMGLSRVDPKGKKLLADNIRSMGQLSGGNDVYVLVGRVAHIPTDADPVPDIYSFEVKYRFQGSVLAEIAREDPPEH